MLPRLQPRVVALALGAGALTGGLIMALLGAILSADYVGLMAAGLVIAGMGLLLGVVGAIGFALHGPVRTERE